MHVKFTLKQAQEKKKLDITLLIFNVSYFLLYQRLSSRKYKVSCGFIDKTENMVLTIIFDIFTGIRMKYIFILCLANLFSILSENSLQKEQELNGKGKLNHWYTNILSPEMIHDRCRVYVCFHLVCHKCKRYLKGGLRGGLQYNIFMYLIIVDKDNSKT